jgi:hypothetical protein
MDEMEGKLPLRALSIGEIFDRAITIYVRNFVVFTLIIVTLLGPLAIAQYLLVGHSTETIAQAFGQIGHPGVYTSRPVDPGAITALIAVALLGVVLAPFASNAVAVGVASIYSGTHPSYTAGFAPVFKRWLPLLGTLVLNVGVGISAYIVSVVAFFIVFAIGIFLLKSVALLGIVVLIFGGMLLLAIGLLAALLAIACTFALYAATIEDAPPGRALGEAFRRIFNMRELRKASFVGIASIAMYIGAALISVAVELLIETYVHSTLLVLTFSTILNAMLATFVTILLAVYYYDVRTRSEGLDLEVALKRLSTVP